MRSSVFSVHNVSYPSSPFVVFIFSPPQIPLGIALVGDAGSIVRTLRAPRPPVESPTAGIIFDVIPHRVVFFSSL